MEKMSTGIDGLDSILNGGYPGGKSTLLKGGPGSGKTIFCMMFARRCILDGIQVVYMASEEDPSAISNNIKNYGIDTHKSEQSAMLKFIDLRQQLSDEVAGDFELDAILLRLQSVLDQPKAVVIIDSLQNLFIGIKTDSHVRSLLKLFEWCRQKNITLLVTAAEGMIKGFEFYFEEYASDCVILLKQYIYLKLMTRYLNVLKYRGTAHGSNEYPFLITGKGISIFPITNSQLSREQSNERFSTGITELDAMLGGGYIESTSIMISGASGTAKSLFASCFAEAFAKKNQKVLFITYEESMGDYVKNIQSIGIDFKKLINNGQLKLEAVRASEHGIEEHLISIIELVHEFNPGLVIIDPITSLLDLGTSLEVKSLLIRFMSYIKNKKITILLSELVKESNDYKSVFGVSSLVDTWIRLFQVESNGEFNRAIHIVKSRGSYTSNQLKEFKITHKGIFIDEPYVGSGGIIFGSAKEEKNLLDKLREKSLSAQLIEIDKQLEELESKSQDLSNLERIEVARLKFELMDKKQLIETSLQDIKALRVLNKDLRDH